MSKRQKKQTKPNLAPAALLRARLEALWHAPAAPQPTADQVEAGLQAASHGLKPETVVSVVLSLFPTVRPGIQAALDGLLPEWLARQNYLSALASLASGGQLPAALQPIARRWLAAAGREVSAVTASTESSFHSAYALDDGSQAAVSIFWYSNPHRNRASGFQFLIDHNPPWDGSIKDVFQFPHKPPKALIEHYVQVWKESGQTMTPIGAGEVKRKLLKAVLAHRAANIRLP